MKQWRFLPAAAAHTKLNNLPLAQKLNLGFGTLAVLTLLVVGRTYFTSAGATDSIHRTQAVRMPSALASAQAQANLLNMMSDMRGYLATGEADFQHGYHNTRHQFEQDLATLNRLLNQQPTAQKQRLLELQTTYQKWSEISDKIFSLQDKIHDNQPALKILEQEGEVLIGRINNLTRQMLTIQEDRPDADIHLLKEILEFNSTFSLMISALRSYLVTRDPEFRFEYSSQLAVNQKLWEHMAHDRQLMTAEQQALLDQIAQKRKSLLKLPDTMFRAVESDRYRQDLYLFQSQSEPLADRMLKLLHSVVTEQQTALTQELQAGSSSLDSIQGQNLLTGIAAIAFSLGMTIFFRRQIANPIQRLTEATTQITEGNLDVNAPVESQDEIGTLAVTFNQMTAYLKESQENLQTYNRNLEAKVEERTQELQSKNQQLEQAFDELKQTQIQLIQTEKMSSLGQLVAGIAHEINNPVNFIHGNVSFARQYIQQLLELFHLYQSSFEATPEIDRKIDEIDPQFLEEDLQKIITSMQVGTDRIREIVKSLRIFSRLDEAEVKSVNIHEGIDSTLMILQSRLKETGTRPAITITKNYGDIPAVECYAGQLNQVIMNILSNGIDALEDAIAQNTCPDWTPSITLETSATAGYFTLQIMDNGPGMAEEVKQRLFDPFFTTKEVGKGTGLGMSISHQIITEKHGGKLECVSTPGAGATFIIAIPILQPSR
jgi:signal transduction histidine kinase